MFHLRVDGSLKHMKLGPSIVADAQTAGYQSLDLGTIGTKTVVIIGYVLMLLTKVLCLAVLMADGGLCS